MSTEPPDVHIVTTAKAISDYIDAEREAVICFRCGESGHVRANCLTHKVRPCWMHLRGGCTDPHCSFAHGDEELRTPWKARCVRVVRHGNQFISIGCNSTLHTFRRCPMYKDMVYCMPLKDAPS